MKLARAVFAALLLAAPAFAQGAGRLPASGDPGGLVADSVAVRFHAPDIGGAARPHFATARQISFEARLLALEEDPVGIVQPRHVRAAVDAHIAETILSELPLEPPVDAATLSRTVEKLRAGTEQRVGGREAIEHAELFEGIAPREYDEMIVREARAAIWLDRSLAPFLSIDEDELREKYRTTSNPFRGRRFEDVRDDLAHWLVLETFRAAEQSYLQTARSRITVVYF